ncbi:pilus assembly protein CpaF [Rathayibacter sp. PhB93]|uniref:TadA family conjugal transfer-associated ATPase n=1 Tax=unclassified Rathayibacter TaxID=2609250 RepID=UPI000F46BCF4|nr:MULTISPECIES: TadA family conjugal transfer-associated ATPase [unclassified Rathayibacter]ROQ03257.1 pilus assembly protein CpaF [Rathayibacter sp. PhB93]TDQ09070.1 pilus assembly protein CpaF [Rathayibacter sp. PhB1]
MTTGFVPLVPAAYRPDAPRPPGEDDGGAPRTAPVRPAAAALGLLAPFAADPAVTDLFVNGDSGLWLDRGGGAVRVPSWTLDAAGARRLAVSLVAAGGRHVDEASPCVDVRLKHGVRVHVVLPPVATAGTLISVRVPRADAWSLDELHAAGMLDDAGRGLLRRAVAARWNLLVTGAGGSGKTTLLGALLGCAPPHERLVVIEDVGELRPAHPHVVSLEARQPNLEGAGGVGLDRLVREALRMRPDRLVLGECRGVELRDLLSALNTGHDGGAGTLHANSLADVPARLEALGSLAGMGPEAVARQTVSAIDLVLHLERRSGRRRLAASGCFRLDRAGRLRIEEGAVPQRGSP